MTKMKVMLSVLMMVGVIGSVSARAEMRAQETKDVPVAISDAYIPSGFDSGSDAFVVVNGLFPNSCYRWKEAIVSHSGATTHEIRSMAQVTEGMCLMMLVPFTHEVQLGKLEKGSHTLRFMSGDGTYLEKRMTIE